MKQFQSPSGSPITGTLETIRGAALISGIHPDGTPEYAGDTTVYWDSQRTLKRDGKAIFVDEDGEEWTFDQLTPIEDEENAVGGE